MNMFDSIYYPTREPEKVVSGDFWAWKRQDLTDYDTASYTLTYEAVLESSKKSFTITATGSGTDYLVEVPSTTTAAYPSGIYHWTAFITRNSDSSRVSIGSGLISVVENRAVSQSDPRSHVKRTLDAIEAVIEGRASSGQESHTINGRSLSKTPIADLLTLRDRYKAEYEQELKAQRIAEGKGHNGKILVRFR